MVAVKRETPANRGGDSGRLIERIGGRLDHENTRNRTRLQYFLRLSRIVAAVVAALKSGATR